jgi:hypothetical protein
MPLPDLSGITLKVKRACQQLDALKQEIAVFLDGDPYEPSVHFHTIRGRAVCTTTFTIRMIVHKECDPMWAVKLGEIVHNFRCALDHSVHQLFFFLHEKFPPDRFRNQFPIFIGPAKFKLNGLPMLRGLNRESTNLIESFQPFSTGENVRSPLWHLGELSNFDKHRTLHLTGGTLEAFKFTFPPLVNPGRISKTVRERGAFQNNTIIAEGQFIGRGHPFGDQEVKMKADCLFNVVFDERTPVVPEYAVIGTLLDIADRTVSILEKISADIFGMKLALPRPADSTRPKPIRMI